MTSSDSSVARPLRFWLEYRGHRIELRSGETIIGRSSTCQLVLDDALVSRAHACITVWSSGASVVDRGSANGVFLNGEKIRDVHALADGDRITMGRQEMVLHASEGPMKDYGKRSGAATLHGVQLPAPDLEHLSDITEADPTSKSNALDMLGGVADKVLALGRGEHAEKILGALLESILLELNEQRTLEQGAPEKAAAYAIKLAGATHKGSWVDYVFALYAQLKKPLPGIAIDQLHVILRNVNQVDITGLRRYLAVLRAGLDGFSPNERFLVQRIEGLERIAALK